MCSRHIEDGGHLFFNCKFVKQVGRELFLEEQPSTLATMLSAKEVVTHILQMEEAIQQKVILLLYHWWNERNRVREGDKRRTVGDLAYVVWKNAEESIELHKEQVHAHVNVVHQWRKPPSGWFKINSDGAFSAGSGEGDWSFVIRNEEGEFILAGAGKLKHIRDAFQAEVQARIEGVKAAIEAGIAKVILETDSLTLKYALENNSQRLAEAGGMIYELKNLAHGGFSSYLCNFAPRSCNKVAHALAAVGCTYPHGDVVHWDITPSLVEDLLASDSAAPVS